MADAKKFPFAGEVAIPPELTGWEEMYAPQRLFSKDREDWEKRHFWYQDKIHAPEPLYPLDDIFRRPGRSPFPSSPQGSSVSLRRRALPRGFWAVTCISLRLSRRRPRS